MKNFQAPNPPFVQARHTNAKHRPTAIVLSLSWTTSEKKAALGIANRLHRGNAPANSYHYIVDEAEIYRGVWDKFGAASTPHGALDVLLCAQPQETLADWQEESASKVLEQAADLVADLILAYKIRPRYLDNKAEAWWKVRRWRRRGGIIANIPGAWPSASFFARVQFGVAQKKKEK